MTRILHMLTGPVVEEEARFFGALIPHLRDRGLEQLAVVRRANQFQSLVTHNIPSLCVPCYGRLDPWTPYALKRAIGQFTPNIVLSWMPEAAALCARIKTDKANFIHCGWAGGSDNASLYQQCDHMICGSQPVFDAFVQAGWSENKLHHLPPFVDCKSMPPVSRSHYSTPKDAPLLLGVGPLNEEQGFDVLIKAINELPHAYIWIIGDGPWRDHLEALAVERGVRPRVRFLGNIKDKARFFAAADILVCPFRNNLLSSVIAEAWGYATPVIAAASAGPRALIQQDKTGVLFAAEDHRDLARTLKRFFLNPGLRRELVKTARKIYETDYSQENVVPRFISFFENVISGHS